MQRILDSVIGKAGRKLLKPAIAASVKTAVAQAVGPVCSAEDIPRSRTSGFDFDGTASAISYFGQCRPVSGAKAAVSYRYWVPETCAPDCGGACVGNEICDTISCTCKCPETITCPVGQKFDPTTCGCVCDLGALDCGDKHHADANSCSCVCKDNCGGMCNDKETCNMSVCACIPILE